MSPVAVQEAQARPARSAEGTPRSVTLASWNAMWRELGAPHPDESLFRQLVACWSEPHRHYHTLQHLRECLEHFEGARILARHPAEIELALWFHDAFYDVHRQDNEARSADWARDAVQAAGLPQDVGGRVHALVMATCHREAPQEPDAQLLVDVDLAILGADRERFDESDAQIRREFAHVAEADFRVGRRRVLRGFLDRPRIYSTERFAAAFELRARDNIARSLRRLED
jgi:predicted metal-dependent HD superfamily phosphohydrolase